MSTGIDCSAVSFKETTVLTMLSPLATTNVVSGAESLPSCQISPDQLQRSWFVVTSALSKPVVLTELLLLLGIQPPLPTSLFWRLVKAAVLVRHVDGLTKQLACPSYKTTTSQ